MQELKRLLCLQEVEFNALNHLIMCFPYILHICVTHVIQSFTDAECTTISEAWIDVFPNRAEHNMYVQGVNLDPIGMGCTIVQVIRASLLCCDEFMDTMKTGNLKGWFKSPIGEVDHVTELELLCDVNTCWNSTFAMINHLRALHLVSHESNT